MRRICDPQTLLCTLDELRAEGEVIGVVPTMGALHDGHLSLVRQARAAGASRIALTIFVNPMQFGPREDLARYPQTLEQDVARCRELEVDVLFTPGRDQIYPAGFQTRVEVGQVSRRWEGQARPGHFAGVATIVAKLFAATGPCVAAFGRKDYQQLRVIETMVRDLGLPVRVVPCPIVREPDGLAMSSRNAYLSVGERSRASAIYRGLRAAQEAYRAGERQAPALTETARAPLVARMDRIDYLAVADALTLEPLHTVDRAAVMLVAAHLGKTRLLDNVLLGAASELGPRARG